MKRGVRRGLDYTPLYRFLLSKVGQQWADVHSEAVSRLDKPDPIFDLVALWEEEAREVVRTGETSYFSGLYVDDQGVLQKTRDEVDPEELGPFCSCCTFTLNGRPLDDLD